MAEPRSRGEKIAIAFMAVWTIVWTAGMLIVLYGVVKALLAGNLPAVAFMLVWLAAAALGLFLGARKLRMLLVSGRPAPPSARNHEWRDGTPG